MDETHLRVCWAWSPGWVVQMAPARHEMGAGRSTESEVGGVELWGWRRVDAEAAPEAARTGVPTARRTKSQAMQDPPSDEVPEAVSTQAS